MTQEIVWILLSKKLAGEATQEELKQLENLITKHPEWQYAIQNLEDLWNHQPPKDTMQEEDAYMLHLHRMHEKAVPFEEGPVSERPATRIGIRSIRWYWAAAAILVVTGILFFRNWMNSGDENQLAVKNQHEISTRPGSKSRVQLPDGTVVMLNAGSKLTYEKDFGQGLREVTLIGEGFFDVVKMKDIPFIIHTSSINIKVLGTAFNVKAYPEDKQTETSLIRGSIEVTINNRPNDKIILSPSEKLVVENGAEPIKEKVEEKKAVESPEIAINTLVSINKLKYDPVDSSIAETLWVENILGFQDESFEEIAHKMERWYNVGISITDPKLRQKRFTGSFRTETIEQALEALKISVPFKYNQTGNNYIIHR
ncbi:MAG TPA: FecR family protein [Chitinophagaceae bacterium]|nr:FecR family protein [Chitinophagaceae bacterium]